MTFFARSGVGSVVNPRASRVARVGNWEVAERVTEPALEDAAVRESVALIDQSAGHRFVAGGPGLDSAFGNGLEKRPAGARELATSGTAWSFRSRHDEAYLSAPPSGDLPPAFSRFRELLEGAGGLWTDVTHSFDVIAVVGPDAAATLSKLCSLDFHDDRFPNGTAAWSGLAKVSALLVRRDRARHPVYELHVDRSLGAYLWEALVDACSEFGGLEAGLDALPG